MKKRLGVFQIAFALAFASPLSAAELSQQTLSMWEKYLGSAKLEMQDRVAGKLPFLWMDEDPATKMRVAAGAIVVSPLGKTHPLAIPNGLIHRWVGAVFIPGATMDDLAAVMGDYRDYRKIYQPTLVKAELLDSRGDEQTFSVIWVQKVLLLNAAFYTEMESKNVALSSRRGYMTFASTRIQQIENYGERDERRLPPDEGRGYLWRLVSFARFEEQDGGLYLELEVIGLTKDIPASLRFFLKPVIDHVPRQALNTKLEQTRQAIRSRAAIKAANRLSSWPRQLFGVVKNYANRMAMPGTNPAHAVSKIHPVEATRSLHRAMMHGEGHGVPLA